MNWEAKKNFTTRFDLQECLVISKEENFLKNSREYLHSLRIAQLQHVLQHCFYCSDELLDNVNDSAPWVLSDNLQKRSLQQVWNLWRMSTVCMHCAILSAVRKQKEKNLRSFFSCWIWWSFLCFSSWISSSKQELATARVRWWGRTVDSFRACWDWSRRKTRRRRAKRRCARPWAAAIRTRPPAPRRSARLSSPAYYSCSCCCCCFWSSHGWFRLWVQDGALGVHTRVFSAPSRHQGTRSGTDLRCSATLTAE